MDDLISRQAAIDALDGEIIVTGKENAEAVRGYANLALDRIKRLPSAQPEAYEVARDIATIIENEKDMRVIQKNAEQKWTPVTERLPEPYITVLVTYKSGVVSFAWYNGSYWTRGAMPKQKKLKTVKAWMSLPAPYEGE